MNHTPLPINRRPAGAMLIEVMIGIILLTITIMAIADGMITSMMSTAAAREQQVAFRAAQEKLEEYVGKSEYLTKPSSVEIPSRAVDVDPRGMIKNSEFDVIIPDKLTGKYDPINGIGTKLTGINGKKPGEVVLVTYENRGPEAYGRDLDGDGYSDGINFRQPNFDLTMDGVIQTDEVQRGAKRLPLGVIIRWIGAKGREEKVELWTIVMP